MLDRSSRDRPEDVGATASGTLPIPIITASHARSDSGPIPFGPGSLDNGYGMSPEASFPRSGSAASSVASVSSLAMGPPSFSARRGPVRPGSPFKDSLRLPGDPGTPTFIPSVYDSNARASPTPGSLGRSSWYGDDRLNHAATIAAMGPPPTLSNILSPPSPGMNAFPSPPPRSSSPFRQQLNGAPNGSLPKQPFNFESVAFQPASPAKPNQRRGHRYKNSSVSMNYFQEPPPRAPLAIPASLPIPNFNEWRQSMSRDQRIRLFWCVFHLIVAIAVYSCDVPFTAISALAHLLLYDAMGAILCASVDVLGNFDVWKQSSIHLPFGLERVEILAGFALSVSLVFMGGDIMSHVVQDLLNSFYSPGEGHHHGHHHGHSASADVSDEDYDASLRWASMVLWVMLGVLATVVSAVVLQNHSRINRAIHRQKTAAIAWLPALLSNPSHFMTLTFSVAILSFPLFGGSGHYLLDGLLTPAIAISMCYIGWLHAKALAGMLIMSYSGPDHIEEIEALIRQNPLVESVSDISLWQVHHALWLATLRVSMKGTNDDERRLREQATSTVLATMGGDDQAVRWEVTVDINRLTLE